MRLILPFERRKTPFWPPWLAKSSCNSPQVPSALPQSAHVISVVSVRQREWAAGWCRNRGIRAYGPGTSAQSRILYRTTRRTVQDQDPAGYLKRTSVIQRRLRRRGKDRLRIRRVSDFSAGKAAYRHGRRGHLFEEPGTVDAVVENVTRSSYASTCQSPRKTDPRSASKFCTPDHTPRVMMRTSC